MTPENNIGSTIWNDLKTQALTDTEEGWSLIDQLLPDVCDNQVVVKNAFVGLNDSSEHIQDLSASIFQTQDTDAYKANNKNLGNQLVPRLKKVVEYGHGPYAQFRAAFALYKHGDRADFVVDKVKMSTTDPDVADIAKELLATT